MDHLSNKDVITVCSCCCSNIINVTDNYDIVSTHNSKSQDELIIKSSEREENSLNKDNCHEQTKVQTASNSSSQITDNEHSIQIKYTPMDDQLVVDSTSTTLNKIQEEQLEKKNERENVSSVCYKDLKSSSLPSSSCTINADYGGKSIEERLAMIFEFPYLSRNEKTLFSPHSSISDANHPLTFCSKCDTALTQLYQKYCEFITLLQSNNNNHIYHKIQKVGIENSQSLLPVVIYNDNNFQLNNSNVEWEKVESLLPEPVKRNLNSRGFIVLHDSQNNCQKVLEGEGNSTNTENSTNVNIQNNNWKDKTTTRRRIPEENRRRKKSPPLTARQKILSLRKNQKEDPKKSKSKNSSKKQQNLLEEKNTEICFEGIFRDSSSQEQQEVQLGEDVIMDDDDVSKSITTVIVVSVDNNSSPEEKQEVMRRRCGRKPGRRNIQSIQSTNKPNNDVCDNNTKVASQPTNNSNNNDNVKNQPSPKRKRGRQLKKEFWYEEAKNDPERKCDICNKVFLYNRMMIHHKATVHEGKRPYYCKMCGRSFTQNFILKKHTCDYRLASCSDREFLMLAREEQLFKWQCNVCMKKFKERSSLNVHQMNHMGENFECGQCEKKFRRPDHLKTHMKIVHSDEKKFTCFNCGKSFKTSSNLRAHERKHLNPDQKHLCNICGRSIRTLSQMARHEKTHDDFLPYQCPVCGKRFKMKDYLGQHLRKGKTCKLPKKTNLNTLIVKENPNKQQVTSSSPLSDKSQQNFDSSFSSSKDIEDSVQLQETSQSGEIKKEQFITVEFDSSYSTSRENTAGEESILSPTLELTYTIQTGEDGILTNL